MSDSNSEILSFRVSNFNKVVATFGGFLTLFGLVSYLLKEKFYLGEALISLIAGLIFSPHATNLIRPLEYTRGSIPDLNAATLYFTHLVLDVQLVLAGIQLPSKYLKKEWKSLALLLGPGMCVMWILTTFIVWALVPDITILYALAAAACVTPTDPVLSNSIVKGKFADTNIPKGLQHIIIAESGANDGLGYPFLFLALYLIRYTQDGGLGQIGGAGKAMGYWFGITWGYTIIMSPIYGALVGWLFKIALQWAKKRGYVDRESFLVFSISIALFICGTLGMIGADDVLASFVAGNVFNWDDWFRSETQDDSFQPTIDMLLNVAIFAYYGAICPWYQFAYNSVIPIYRLIFIGILVLLFRRPPMVGAFHKILHQSKDWRQNFFLGFFGPIGVSAIFYLYTANEYLQEITVNGQPRPDTAKLQEIITIVVWFMVISSIIVHGLSIPLAKFFFSYLPKTMSKSSGRDNDRPFQIQESSTPWSRSRVSTSDRLAETAQETKSQRRIYRIGGSIIKDTEDNSSSSAEDRELKDVEKGDDNLEDTKLSPDSDHQKERVITPMERRIIRFPDDPSENIEKTGRNER